jgi:hypothetical protein
MSAVQKRERYSMPRNSAAPRPLAPSTQTPWHPGDLLAELQATLAMLADIEVRYEMDREQLEVWDGPEAIKQKFAAQLNERHQRDREPYVQRLTDLHHRITTIMAPQVPGPIL